LERAGNREVILPATLSLRFPGTSDSFVDYTLHAGKRTLDKWDTTQVIRDGEEDYKLEKTSYFWKLFPWG
jgi:hypothetical protein